MTTHLSIVPPTTDPGGELSDAAAISRFVLAGNSTFTLVSLTTGTRFSYRVRAPKLLSASALLPTLWFVSVLTGPSNEADFQFMGSVFRPHSTVLAAREGLRYHPSPKSKVSRTAPSSLAFRWFVSRLAAGRGPAPVGEFWHEGKCGRCGRKLTVPESIASGLGPECAGRSS